MIKNYIGINMPGPGHFRRVVTLVNRAPLLGRFLGKQNKVKKR